MFNTAESIYEACLEGGVSPDIEALVAEYPQYVSELRMIDARWRAFYSSFGSRDAQRQRQKSSLDDQRQRLERSGARQGFLPRYELKGELGRGGMGRVFRAHDRLLDRNVAVKEMLPGDGEEGQGPRASRNLRFLREAELLARLDHPGIVPIHEVGFGPDGHPYFVMGQAEGRPLADGLRGRSALTRKSLLLATVQLARIVAYAHARDIIHRDIKPTNVLVGDHGEVSLVDWGVAHDTRHARVEQTEWLEGSLDDGANGSTITLHGDVVGTRPYMAPEQATGVGGTVGPQLDVYALGAILFEVVTGTPLIEVVEGHPPLGAESPAGEHRQQAVLSALRGESADLQAICSKSLQEDPIQRYPDAGSFADSLELLLAGHVVPDRRAAPWERFTKWVAREPTTAGWLTCAVIALVVGGIGTIALGAQSRARGAEARRLAVSHQLQRLRERSDTCWPISESVHPELVAIRREAEALTGLLDGNEGIRAQWLRVSERSSGTRTQSTLSLVDRADLNRMGYEAGKIELDFLEGFAPQAGGPLEGSTSGFTIPDSADLEDLEFQAWRLVAPGRNVARRDDEALATAEFVIARAPRGTPLEARARMTRAWACLRMGFVDAATKEARIAASVAEGRERTAIRHLHETLLRQILGMSSESMSATKESCRRLIANLERERYQDQTQSPEFATPDDAWLESQLARAVNDLEALEDPSSGWIDGRAFPSEWSLARRIDESRALEARLDDPTWRDAWDDAQAIASATSSRYRGLSIPRAPELVPLGLDPDTNLLEFAHALTGSVPMRNDEGTLQYTHDSAVVLVLLPAGRAWIGAQSSDPAGFRFDPYAVTREGPPHYTDLEAFYLAKHELTQEQWAYFTSLNPGPFGPSTHRNPIAGTNRMPVTRVSWRECSAYLHKLGLTLPTEYQWEYGARAGLDTPWTSGPTSEGLDQFANVADRAAQSGDHWRSWRCDETLNDGWIVYSPVGSFRPNAFGLFDMHGNVWEWCLESISSRAGYDARPVGPATHTRSGFEMAPFRGGSYRSSPIEARASQRQHDEVGVTAVDRGLRPARRL